MNYFFSGSNIFFDKLSLEIGLPNVAVTNQRVNYQLSKTELFNHKKCRSAIYDIESWSSIPPLSKKDLLKYSEVEQIYLKMADRLGFIQSYQQRKDEYNKHLRFWNWKLTQNNFDFAIFENVPHEGYNYILYSILMEKKIKVITFYQLPIRPAKTYLLQAVFDIFNHGNEIKKILLSNKFIGNKLTLKMSKKFEGYLDVSKIKANDLKSFTRNKKNTSWFHHKNIFQALHNKIRRYSISDIKKNLAMRMGYDNYLSSNRKLMKFYKQNEVTPSLQKPYIYFTFHYQPELSTSPLGGVFVDQILACEILAFAAKRLNINVYVKEHPRGSKAQYTKAHDIYQKLLNYSNVKFLSDKINTYKLIDNCLCASTITGSSGWEALLRKKPVLMFGSRFYEACHGAFSVSSVDEVTKALSSILNGNIKITNNKINSFLIALDKFTFEGFTSIADENIATVSLEKSVNNKISMIKSLIN